jgi:exodeoxyribonuclease VII large subunit
VDDFSFRLELAEKNLLEKLLRRWEDVSAAVRHYDLPFLLASMRRQMETGTAALAAAMRNVLLQHRVRMERSETALNALSPLAILERGYALVFDGEGQLVREARDVKPHDEIRARLARGEIHATVRKTLVDPPPHPKKHQPS